MPQCGTQCIVAENRVQFLNLAPVPSSSKPHPSPCSITGRRPNRACGPTLPLGYAGSSDPIGSKRPVTDLERRWPIPRRTVRARRRTTSWLVPGGPPAFGFDRLELPDQPHGGDFELGAAAAVNHLASLADLNGNRLAAAAGELVFHGFSQMTKGYTCRRACRFSRTWEIRHLRPTRED